MYTQNGNINVPANSRFSSSEVIRTLSMARKDRARTLKTLLGGLPMVFTGLAVSWSGIGLTVNIATGEGVDGDGFPIHIPAAVPATAVPFGLAAEGTNPQVALTAANGANPRIDLVCLRANQLLTDYAGLLTSDGITVTTQTLPQTLLDYFTIVVAQGVPAPAPVAPAPGQATDLVLAQILVPAAAVALDPSNITDVRPVMPPALLALSGTALPTASATYRGKPFTLLGAGGVPDAVYICKKMGNDAYDWFEIPLP